MDNVSSSDQIFWFYSSIIENKTQVILVLWVKRRLFWACLKILVGVSDELSSWERQFSLGKKFCSNAADTVSGLPVRSHIMLPLLWIPIPSFGSQHQHSRLITAELPQAAGTKLYSAGESLGICDSRLRTEAHKGINNQTHWLLIKITLRYFYTSVQLPKWDSSHPFCPSFLSISSALPICFSQNIFNKLLSNEYLLPHKNSPWLLTSRSVVEN